MRGADPVIVLVPGIGHVELRRRPTDGPRGRRVLRERDQRDARRRSRCRRTAPIDDAEKFRVEYWELEERKLRMRPPHRRSRVALRSSPVPARASAGRSPSACRHEGVRRRRRPRRRGRREGGRHLGAERRSGWRSTCPTRHEVEAMFAAAADRFGGVDIVVNNAGFAIERHWSTRRSTTGTDSTPCSPVARSSSVARGAHDDRAGHRWRHRLRRVEERRRRRARRTSPTVRPRRTRRTRSACSPPSSAATTSGSTASTPTAWSRARGSSRASGCDQRAETYGVAPEDLGKYYAGRTLLGREILPGARRRGGVRARRGASVADHRLVDPGRRWSGGGVLAVAQDRAAWAVRITMSAIRGWDEMGADADHARGRCRSRPRTVAMRPTSTPAPSTSPAGRSTSNRRRRGAAVQRRRPVVGGGHRRDAVRPFPRRR